jgi:tetratricopeptide (TPR) repeat protein
MTASDDDRAKARELHELARTLPDEEALAVYRQVLQLDANRPETHYNVGLIYKYQAKWPESFEHNKKAAELDPVDEAINWNLAIVATALRDWRTAREVWNRLGKNVELGTDPIDLNFGITPVRLNPEDGAEVVWGRRIDPVRARECARSARSGHPHTVHKSRVTGHWRRLLQCVWTEVLYRERLAQEQPNVTVEFIRGGHRLPFERLDELSERVLDFLSAKRR